MHPRQREQTAGVFHQVVTMGPGRVLAVSDRIRHIGQGQPDLVARCQFTRSIQARRLKTVAWKHWQASDWVSAQAILAEVAALQPEPASHGRTLALAVLGVETEGLDGLMDELEDKQAPPAAATLAPAAAARPDPAPQPTRPAPTPTPRPAQALATNRPNAPATQTVPTTRPERRSGRESQR